ncbi:hypothetical protein H2204_001515 [Knufia peltigerae]|uniref:Uncharacterized protein n=1 Tax=Knufia peltigerae TaxID=1002370 RepID=A0AA38YE75_9EURO|nr:hypothetical protein H2204_001515 [Knufia peltigerae]
MAWWPVSSELYDRRYRAHQSRQCTDAQGQDGITFVTHDVDEAYCRTRSPGDFSTPMRQNPKMHSAICSNDEIALLQHYLDAFGTFVLLGTAHAAFRPEYLVCIARFTLTYAPAKCAILACCASNKYQLTKEEQFRKLSLKYYCQAVKEINVALTELENSRSGPNDALVTAVVHMYINALWGPELHDDAANHVVGAVQLLKLRYAKSPLCMEQPMHRINAESVIYQSFLLSMEHPLHAPFEVDTAFLAQTQNVLSPPTFSDSSAAANSPVLGVPLQLFCLISDVMQLYKSPELISADNFTRIKREMVHWEHVANTIERAALSPTDPTPVQEHLRCDIKHEYPHTNAMLLYIFAGSLLLDWVVELIQGQSEDLEEPAWSPPGKPRTEPLLMSNTVSSPSPPSSLKTSWQLSRALAILRRPEIHESWTLCHLGWWPMMIFGYAVNCDEDIALVKHVLLCMRQRTGYGLLDRILAELEQLWAARDTSWALKGG